ncbi:protein MOS2 [Senna tora]|uniref:Protein MOS2 n=1 Tax=Senna tora TaxID=362788 RepID=A0A834X2Y8_9FABA|nr:protein MOS2 [Senna tora]
MKLSFSIPSKSSSKSNPTKPAQKFDDDANIKDGKTNAREYVTEFDASKSRTDPNKSTNIVIPPLKNEWEEWKASKRMKNLDLPITESNGTELGFEMDTSTAEEPGSDMSYGLNLRQTGKTGGDDKQSATVGGGGDDNGRLRPVTVESVMLQKFKDDMKRLPDDQGFDEFKDVSVEGFGAALLAGYGWREGMGIGKNSKEDVKVVQYERRAGKEGLGFVSDNARMRSFKEVEIPKGHRRDGSFVGKIVRIVGGRDVGLKGKVVRKVEDKWVVLELLKNEEEVKVGIDDIAELGSIEEERCLKKLKELKIQHADKDKDSKKKRHRDDERRRGHGEVKMDVKRDSKKEEDRKKQVSWLASHIRVRIISKDFKGGRLYLKKARILDVVGPTTCVISMDDSKEIIEGVSQDFLETAIPRRCLWKWGCCDFNLCPGKLSSILVKSERLVDCLNGVVFKWV